MKSFMKKLIIGLLVFTMCMPTSVTNVSANAVAKLSDEDLFYTVDGERETFDLYGANVNYYWYFCKTSKIVTNRGIQMNDTATRVMKKYGMTTKQKFSAKEEFHKYLKYYEIALNTSDYTSYLEYSYKKNKDKRTLRFYLDSNDKVIGIFFIQNIQDFKLAKKTVDIKLKYRVPKGKKMSTKMIDGKKVAIVPKGTKIATNPADQKEFGLIYLIDKNGNVIANPYEIINCFFNDQSLDEAIKCVPKWDYKKMKHKNKNLRLSTLGEYKYFMLVYKDYNYKTYRKKPKVFYFRFK